MWSHRDEIRFAAREMKEAGAAMVGAIVAMGYALWRSFIRR